MAPQVVRGERATFAADVWSLGVVAHEIVFGQRPTWRRPARSAATLALPARALPRTNAAVFDACRAFMVEAPAAKAGRRKPRAPNARRRGPVSDRAGSGGVR